MNHDDRRSRPAAQALVCHAVAAPRPRLLLHDSRGRRSGNHASSSHAPCTARSARQRCGDPGGGQRRHAERRHERRTRLEARDSTARATEDMRRYATQATARACAQCLPGRIYLPLLLKRLWQRTSSWSRFHHIRNVVCLARRFGGGHFVRLTAAALRAALRCTQPSGSLGGRLVQGRRLLTRALYAHGCRGIVGRRVCATSGCLRLSHRRCMRCVLRRTRRGRGQGAHDRVQARS